MIQFQISAPTSLNLFGEHSDNILRASMDLRTTLNFQELNSSNNIEINFPKVNIFHKMPLPVFLKFYDNCVKNIEQLHLQVLLFTYSFALHEQRFLQIFYYLLIYIMYKEQIAEIKEFRIDLSTKLLINKKFFCPASLKVCLAACLLHWTRLQKNIQNTFDDTDLKAICIYAKSCENTVSELDIIDIRVCTYGLMIQYDKERNIFKTLNLPRIMILLVDSKQTQDVEVQNEKITELATMLPQIKISIVTNINKVTNKAADTFKKIFDIYNAEQLPPEIKHQHFLQQYEQLGVSHVT